MKLTHGHGCLMQSYSYNIYVLCPFNCKYALFPSHYNYISKKSASKEIKNTRQLPYVRYRMNQGGLPLHKLPTPSTYLFYVTQNFKHGLQTQL